MSRSSNGEFMNFRPKKNVLQPFSNLREKKRSRSELVAARSLLSCKRIRCKAQYENRSFWAEKLGKMKKKCFWPGSPAPGPPDAQGDMGGRSQGEMLNFHTGIEHCTTDVPGHPCMLDTPYCTNKLNSGHASSRCLPYTAYTARLAMQHTALYGLPLR